RLYEYLRTLHASFLKQRNNHYYYLPFADVMKKGWFIAMMRNVQDQGYSIHGLPQLKKFRYTTHIPKFTITAATNIDLFDLKVTVQWGDQMLALKEVRQAILNHQDTIMLEDGTLGHIPEEWISQYSLLLRTGKEENGTLRVSKDRKSTRLNSSHVKISYAVFCLKQKSHGLHAFHPEHVGVQI